MLDGDEHHSVYRQDSVLSISDVEREMHLKLPFLTKKGARDDIKAGGLFCSHGSRMTFVISENRKNHFRHVVAPTAREGNYGGGSSAPTSCGCSSRHLDAQALLRDHDYSKQSVAFTEWRDCKKPECCKTVYTATGALDVRLEVRENQGKFVSDVVYYSDNEACMRVEVYATHKADRDKRVGTEFVEVSAQHVAESFKAVIGATIVLRCEGSCTGQYEACVPCAERKRVEREQAEARRQRKRVEREQAKAEEARRERKRVEREQAEAEEEAERQRLRREDAEQKQAEKRAKTAAMDAARAAREAERAVVVAAMQVELTPSFRVTLGTDVPKISQEETDRRRAERMARQAERAAKQARRRRGRGGET